MWEEYEYEYDEDEQNKSLSIPIGSLNISASSTGMMSRESSSRNDVFKIHLLGKTYHPILDYANRRSDERSLFWFTYRCDFPVIVPYSITTDAGWGCMLRSAQMMLAQALRLHYRGREWYPPQSIVQRRTDQFYRSILTWFADFPSHTECRYSLHNMVATGLSRYETLPGEWYGPGTACYVLRDLCQLHEEFNRKIQVNPSKDHSSKEVIRGPMFRVYIASQGSVYKDAVNDLMTRDGQQERKNTDKYHNSNSAQSLPSHPLDPDYQEEEEQELDWDTALLILVPLRLGLKSFNDNYAAALAHIFSVPQSVGVLGGRPRGARWFYGATSDGAKLYGLDPHTVQSAPQVRKGQNAKTVVALTEEYIRSVHCRSPEVIQMQRMDPSLALGFYCRSRADFDDFCNSMTQWRQAHAAERSSPDLFAVADAVPDYSANVSSVMNEMMLSAACGEVGGGLDSNTNDFLVPDGDQADLSDEDEYVML